MIDCTHFRNILLVIIMLMIMLMVMLMVMLILTNTSHPRNSNIIRIHLQRKVLQRLRVMHSLSAVSLCQLQHPTISISVVLDETLSDSRHVVEPVKQVAGPEGVCLGS